MKIEDYFKYYIQGSEHYLIPKDVFIELFNEMVNWREESKELNQKYLNAVVDYEITMSDKTELKKQLEYLRSGEYYNQLRFENEMLQQVVDTNGVPSEVYDYIDCTHRNTELLKENQQLKKEYNKAVHKATEFESNVYELQQENQKYKEVINKTITNINILIEIIKQQPTDNALDDLWILDKLNGFKNILKGME